MAVSLADHVSARLQRAGFTVSSPELVRIRDHNNSLFARAAAERSRAAEPDPATTDGLKRRLHGPGS
jgi:hypothetical protein